MSMEARELRQKAGELFDEADEILDRAEEAGEPLSGEDEERHDKLLDAALEKVDRAQELERREQKRAELRTALDERRDRVASQTSDPNVRDFAALDAEERNELQKRAFIKGLKNQVARDAANVGVRLPTEDFTDEERAALAYTREEHGVEARQGQQSVGTSGQGGTFVPEGFRREISEAQEAFGGVRGAADVITTDSGNDLPWPTSDDTQNKGSLVNEATTTSGSTHVPTSNVTLKAWKYQTGPIKASIEILQDSAFDMEAFLRGHMARRIGRITEEHFASTDTGSAQPEGFRSLSTGAVSVAEGSSNLTPESLMDLMHSIDLAYRQNPRVAWMMHDDVWKEITKIRVGSSDEFWLDRDARTGTDLMLLGHPVIRNNSLPENMFSSTNTAPNKPIWFGDWGKYKVRDVRDLSIVRLNERFILEGNIGFIGFARHDGRAVFGSTRAANRPIRALLHNATT